MSYTLTDAYIFNVKKQFFNVIYNLFIKCSNNLIARYKSLEYIKNNNRDIVATQEKNEAYEVIKDLVKLKEEFYCEFLRIETEKQTINYKLHSILDSSAQISDTRLVFSDLVHGFIRLNFEVLYNLNIPYTLKTLCVLFYGNIFIDSTILNMAQITIFGHILIKQSRMNQYHYFKFKKIQSIESAHTALILQTTDGDIIIHLIVAQGSKQFAHSFSLILNTSITTQAVQFENSQNQCIYHFPNNWRIDSRTEISKSHNNSKQNFEHIIQRLRSSSISPKFVIAKYEVYKLL